MSISILLVPLAIGIAATVASASAATASAVKQSQKQAPAGQPIHQLTPMKTIFTDTALLEQTLREHGLPVTVVSGNRLRCQVGGGQLEYHRQTAEEPFYVTVSGVGDLRRFAAEMECFTQEYRQNVQSYTYNKLMENLGESQMRIAEETVMDDNSILLTIDIT